MSSCLAHYEQLLYFDISVDVCVCTNHQVYLYWPVLHAEGTSPSSNKNIQQLIVVDIFLQVKDMELLGERLGL